MARMPPILVALVATLAMAAAECGGSGSLAMCPRAAAAPPLSGQETKGRPPSLALEEEVEGDGALALVQVGLRATWERRAFGEDQAAEGEQPRGDSPETEGERPASERPSSEAPAAEGPPAADGTCEDFDFPAPSRTKGRCVFIDLGASDGSTFDRFLGGGYGDRVRCAGGFEPQGDYEAFLVEGNPAFDTKLFALQAAYPERLRVLPSTAVSTRQTQVTFNVDTVHEGAWGSSIRDQAKKFGGQAVTVPTVNLLRLLRENTIPEDHVIVKMDIEGGEFDILPCLARSRAASLIDVLYMEEHPQFLPESDKGGTTEELQAAKDALHTTWGVEIPAGYRTDT